MIAERSGERNQPQCREPNSRLGIAQVRKVWPIAFHWDVDARWVTRSSWKIR
jgi:hypothetical protein